MKTKIILFILFVPFIVFSSGIPVLDVPNLIQNINNTLKTYHIDFMITNQLTNQAIQLGNDVRKIENQIRQIEYLQQNLKSLKVALKDPRLSGVQKLNQFCYRAQGIGNTIKMINKLNDSLYNNFDNRIKAVKASNTVCLDFQNKAIESNFDSLADTGIILTKSRVSKGINEISQASNELKAKEIAQLSKIHQSIIMQGQQNTVFQSYQIAMIEKAYKEHNAMMQGFDAKSSTSALYTFP